MASNGSFYKDNATVYTETNPASPADVPVTSSNTGAPSSFFKGTGTTPTLTTNGVEAFTPIAHNWLTGLNSLGGWSYAQPSFSDLSGTLAASQVPAGIITNAMLANSTVTIAGHVVSLGGTQAIAFSDLTGTPTLGTAAALNVGTAPHDVVQLDAASIALANHTFFGGL